MVEKYDPSDDVRRIKRLIARQDQHKDLLDIIRTGEEVNTDPEEMLALLRDGAETVYLNKEVKSGIFVHQIEIGGIRYATVTDGSIPSFDEYI